MDIEEIENKIEILSLDEKPKYKLNKDQEKILEYIEKYINSNEIITISGIAGAEKHLQFYIYLINYMN